MEEKFKQNARDLQDESKIILLILSILFEFSDSENK